MARIFTGRGSGDGMVKGKDEWVEELSS